MGSCFSNNIGDLLSSSGFDVCVNPAGIAYNPYSISQHLQANEFTGASHIIKSGDRYLSFHFHSEVSDTSEHALQQKISDVQKNIQDRLVTCDFLFITFGTAFIFENSSVNIIVANCHKQPSELFIRRLLTVDEIISMYDNFIIHLLRINPKLTVVFTVSPVKHLRDGIHGNNLSKSTLLLAIEGICARHKHCQYFPAFELVNDDLRDYRYYKEDMAHPNQLAISYVWEKFAQTYFDDNTARICELYSKLNRSMAHRSAGNDQAEMDKLLKYRERLRHQIAALLGSDAL
jgi:hypothetical protein